MQVNIHEAKTQLSQLLARVAAGEEVVIARSGKPVARLVGFHKGHQERQAGRYAGQGHIAPDFNAPMPNFEDDFYSQ